MPPPNVTGALHLGHAITTSVEDMLIRYHRMQGDPTLWVPGTDHAGIATQNVVERQLERQGITRHALGPRALCAGSVGLEARVPRPHHRPAEAHGHLVRLVARALHAGRGPERGRAEAFIQLYDEGLIYRGNYLVNWCPRCMSAISDLEVEYEEVIGKFYTFRYPLAEGGFLEVSTTRPETILGDTAVAVHPDDARYQRRRRQDGPGAHPQPRHPGDRRRLRGPGVRHRRAQGDARPRSQRLRDRQAPRPAHDQHHEHRRHAQRERRPVRRAGPLRRPQRAVGRHEAGRPGRGRKRACAPGGPLPALRHGGGAAAQRAVVGEDAAAGRAGHRRRARRRHRNRAAALRARLQPLDGEHPRLVHQPPALVGPPHPRLVRAGQDTPLPHATTPRHRPRPQAHYGRAVAPRAGPGRARHLVQQRPVALQHAGLAGHRPKISPPTTPPPCSRRATTSCSSGWRA